MNLTPELKDKGRRNFLKALAGTPAAVALGAAAASKGPIHGGPVRTALIGPGTEGMTLFKQFRKEYLALHAICDINPKRVQDAAAYAENAGFGKPRLYDDWRDMLRKEDLEAVIIATPLWTHAEIATACLESGKHVLCEKMMAWDAPGCRQMIEASRKSGRLLEIGHQRFYNPIYQAAFDGVIKAGVLGDVYYARLAWHRNGSWRRNEQPPSPDYDPGKWGYPTWEHLLNWRMYNRYSRGLMAELASHQVAIANWFFGSAPDAVYASGGIYEYKDGREVPDHIYVTFEYPKGRTATFSSIQSNKFDDYYEMFMGTKGTLILHAETEAMLFNEGEAGATAVEVSKQTSGPVIDSSESRRADTSARTVGASDSKLEKGTAYRLEVSEFCSAVRTGSPLRCGPQRAMEAAIACITGNESAATKARVVLAADEP
ncbi:MAG TPA: Gfo/Idh/MocA family oxidoreductase [Blastocatellia bacterium]|nr:Gfo/Idh/MocA family oxidoreductase [Blastocatellia bacterium]